MVLSISISGVFEVLLMAVEACEGTSSIVVTPVGDSAISLSAGSAATILVDPSLVSENSTFTPAMAFPAFLYPVIPLT
jgi:hypothetical protein